MQHASKAIESSADVPQKNENILHGNPVIPLLVIYWEVLRSGSQRHISSLVFLAALLTIAKLLKQLKWNKEIWQIYTTEYYSAFKMREIL